MKKGKAKSLKYQHKKRNFQWIFLAKITQIIHNRII